MRKKRGSKSNGHGNMEEGLRGVSPFWIFLMPPMPIVLRCSFLFLLDHTTEKMNHEWCVLIPHLALSSFMLFWHATVDDGFAYWNAFIFIFFAMFSHR